MLHPAEAVFVEATPQRTSQGNHYAAVFSKIPPRMSPPGMSVASPGSIAHIKEEQLPGDATLSQARW